MASRLFKRIARWLVPSLAAPQGHLPALHLSDRQANVAIAGLYIAREQWQAYAVRHPDEPIWRENIQLASEIIDLLSVL